MSGGVGPPADIRLPGAGGEEEQKLQHDDPKYSHRKAGSVLSFRQLNALAVVLVSGASGMVSLFDLFFVSLWAGYIYFLSKVTFPNVGPVPAPRVFDPKNRVLRVYVIAGAVVGLVLPVAYIFEGMVEGDQAGVKAAAPHVFLLASQVFMEGVFSDRFSTPIRALVPVIFNARRILTLEEWVMSELGKEYYGGGGSGRRVFVGRVLAVANMAFWSFNLFGFLMPVYLPRALKRYYSSADADSSSVSVSQVIDKSKEN